MRIYDKENKQKDYNWLIADCECYPHNKEIEKLFDQQGYFGCDSLTAKELMMLKDLFDIRVLHLSNKFNVGLQGNINTDVLQDSFFKNVDFIHESNSYTVGMGV